MRSIKIILVLGCIHFSALLTSALAQDAATSEGSVRIQGRELMEEEVPVFLNEGPLIDYSEEMRRFIQDISSYARSVKPDFTIVVENGDTLIVKTDPTNDELLMPARSFVKSVDGILAIGVNYGWKSYATLTPERRLKSRLNLLSRARSDGLAVCVVDLIDDRNAIQKGYAASESKGFVYHSISKNSLEDAILTDYPQRPFNESPKSIVSLREVKNFAIIGNSSFYGREDEYALHMHKQNYDMLIVDPFHGREPLSRQAVETLKYKQVGSSRMVLARIDIGVAASYLYYWQNMWQPGMPPWLSAPLHNDPDRYYVQYWRPEWKDIIYGDAASFIYALIYQGYDGVVLAGADIYEIFEGGERAEERLGQ